MVGKIYLYLSCGPSYHHTDSILQRTSLWFPDYHNASPQNIFPQRDQAAKTKVPLKTALKDHPMFQYFVLVRFWSYKKACFFQGQLVPISCWQSNIGPLRSRRKHVLHWYTSLLIVNCKQFAQLEVDDWGHNAMMFAKYCLILTLLWWCFPNIVWS